MAYRTIDDLDVRDKRVLVRLDLNLPIKDGQITDVTRIERSLPTLKDLARRGAKVVILAHFGRPDGQRRPDMSLAQVRGGLEELLGLPVAFCEDSIGPQAMAAVDALEPGEALLLENTRFHKGEERNDPGLTAAFAELGDFYVNDAFSAAHRAHCTTAGLAKVLPAAAGRAMAAELEALNRVLTAPERPLLAVVGGSKISTKIALLENLSAKVDYLVIGGGMANTFLAARGLSVGKSLCEHDLGSTAQAIEAAAAAAGCQIVLPRDVVVAREFKAMAAHRMVPVEEVAEDEMILDVGRESLRDMSGRLETSKTVVWNGPLGAFETPPFDQGTVEAARMVAMLTKIGQVTSVAGGGDTLAALNEAGAAQDFSYVSTAGGAFLEWLEGKKLPGVLALMA